jgi:hypothetical protein
VLIDRFVPRYDAIEHHEIGVAAPPDAAYEAVRALDLARSPLVLALLAARALPALMRGRAVPSHLTIDDLVRAGFVTLAEEPGSELVLGLVGRFWRPTGALVRIEPHEFVAFDKPGYAKTAWNFAVVPHGDSRSVVLTETRVVCTDPRSRRSFARYWRVVGPFSALIRRRALRLVRQRAEGLSG